jgi:hypothetical protein
MEIHGTIELLLSWFQRVSLAVRLTHSKSGLVDLQFYHLTIVGLKVFCLKFKIK